MSDLVHTHKSENFLATVVLENGIKKLEINAPRYLQHFLNTKTKVGEKISVVLTSKKLKRTQRQNRYYWAYLQHICDETGESDPEVLHNLFRGKFLTVRMERAFGEQVRRTLSTTELSVTDFGQYIDKIAEFTEVEPLPVQNWDLAPTKKAS